MHGPQVIDNGSDGEIARLRERMKRAVGKTLGAVEEVADDAAVGFFRAAVGTLAEGGEGGSGRTKVEAWEGVGGRVLAKLFGHVEAVVVEINAAIGITVVHGGGGGAEQGQDKIGEGKEVFGGGGDGVGAWAVDLLAM